MLLLVASLFPAMMLSAATLRLVSITSRCIFLESGCMVHRQVFKNYTVSFSDISRIEARRGADGEVDTVKILWSGTPFYVDEKAISDFPSFVGALRQRASGVEIAFVTEFSSSE